MTTYVNHRSAEHLELRNKQLKEITGLTKEKFELRHKKKELLNKLKK